MKKTGRRFIETGIGLFFAATLQAQFGAVDFLKGGIHDAEIICSRYFSPWANAFSSGLNSGWYNTAKTHEPGGFDFTIMLSSVQVPASDKKMDLSALGLNSNLIPGENGTFSPTIAGLRTDNRPFLSHSVNPDGGETQVENVEYQIPDGSGLNMVSFPIAQASIGLPLGTEIIGRFIPDIKIGERGNVGLWGVGLKHNIFQYFPGLRHLPVLNASLQGGYTCFSNYANVNFYPSDYEPYATNTVNNILVFKDQKLLLEVKAYTVNLLFSQDFNGISFYQGVGYNSSRSTIALKGNFPYAVMDSNSMEIIIDDSENCIMRDPIDMELHNKNDIRLNAGLRLKLGALTLQFDYTKAYYNHITAGIGINIR